MKLKKFVCLMAVMALVLAMAAPSWAQDVKEVRIGFVLPLSGGSASIGLQNKTGATLAVEQINAFGGVASLGGAKLKLIFADSQTKPDIGSSETERLIKVEKVDIICGAYNSAVTFPASEVAERYKVPWVVTGSVKDEITERGFKYVFRPNNKAAYDANEQISAILDLTKEFGKGPKKIALIYEATDWGRSHAANVKKLAKKHSLDIVLDEPCPPGQVDFNPQLLKIRAKRPEALIIALYTPDHIVFSKQFYGGKIDLPYGLHSVGSGAEDPTFYKSVPPKSYDLMFTQEDWQEDHAKVMGWSAMVNKKFKDIMGYSINAYGAMGYSNVWVIYDALERAGSVDKEKLRAALVATNITSGPALITGYQKISFDENGQNLDAHGVISQNINGERTTIWPLSNRPQGVKPVWPVTKWSDRK
jgi:branched-chain amino acid transport system substrate-binding protein